MNAAPVLARIAAALAECRLEAVLIGNAAAALQGAPVTTLDFDFMFRKTHGNLAKLRRFAERMNASVFRPYYPVSDLYRVIDDESTLQVDFLVTVHGVRSFEGLRARATRVLIAGNALHVASLEDIITSKRTAARARDLAVLPTLEATLDEASKLKEASAQGRPPRRPRRARTRKRT